MQREEEYKRLADFARKRGREEQYAVLRAQWEILGATYVRLANVRDWHNSSFWVPSEQ